VIVKRKKPKIIAFFDPSLFLISALNGAKIICATANTDKIRETSLSSSWNPSSYLSQCASSDLM
jgi:hypothetical protein